ncbi:DUF354 domain-containing protein [uncultured Sanguibacteroides sp.]|uniref:DUF354 domain-containing protein n=1 Tax=uncultured Sanguibacteroides sp. TaxID=1635151 RepID=UPI0025EE3DFA|nr:DUF354 domain-containing protein [uncultured Sanguibacteroides sp.]
MKILIDIGHPAHIHYFKNMVDVLSKKGYEFLFTVRERDSTIELMKNLGYKYVNRGKGGKGLVSKFLQVPIIDCKILKIALRFKPDLFLSFSSPYAAHIATILRKPHIALDDTEHAVLEHLLYRPFSRVILSPSCYNKKLSRNQITFNSYLELCYMHPKYFKPDESILNKLGLKKGEKYCVLRFVSWDANHDVGQHGLSLENKIEMVNKLSQCCKVFISSEQKLPDKLLGYKLSIHPSLLHSVLSFAHLYIGEGSTTASEASVLGVPTIYVNTLQVGYCEEEEKKYGLLYRLFNINDIVSKAMEILRDPESKNKYIRRKDQLLDDKIDATAFMIWFIENWPESYEVMKVNPDYQNRFK